jgi:hypothetical protein
MELAARVPLPSYLEFRTPRSSIVKNYLKLKILRSICFCRRGAISMWLIANYLHAIKLSLVAQMRFPFIMSRIDVSIFK